VPGHTGLGLARMTGSGLGAGFPLGLRQHDLGLDAGAGVNQVVAEEDFRRSCAGGTVLGHVVGTDVDSGGGGFLHELDEVREHPRTGTGQVEQLKGYDGSVYSRRITKEHRLVYKIYDEVVEVLVLSTFGHYR